MARILLDKMHDLRNVDHFPEPPEVVHSTAVNKAPDHKPIRLLFGGASFNLPRITEVISVADSPWSGVGPGQGRLRITVRTEGTEAKEFDQPEGVRYTPIPSKQPGTTVRIRTWNHADWTLSDPIDEVQVEWIGASSYRNLMITVGWQNGGIRINWFSNHESLFQSETRGASRMLSPALEKCGKSKEEAERIFARGSSQILALSGEEAMKRVINVRAADLYAAVSAEDAAVVGSLMYARVLNGYPIEGKVMHIDHKDGSFYVMRLRVDLDHDYLIENFDDHGVTRWTARARTNVPAEQVMPFVLGIVGTDTKSQR